MSDREDCPSCGGEYREHRAGPYMSACGSDWHRDEDMMADAREIVSEWLAQEPEAQTMEDLAQRIARALEQWAASATDNARLVVKLKARIAELEA